MTITREDVELYLIGEYDGDKAALEAAIADDPELRAMVAEEAKLEMLLRDAATEAVFCVGCGDLAPADRCAACGAAVKPGGYVVEKVLVSNAHGRMYIARDADGALVALKELAFVQTPSLDTIAMFEREAKFLRALEHPAIPRFRASFEEGTGVHTRYYLAQELVSGESLEHRLEDHFFTEAEILDIGRQVLEVLVYLQALSPMVIHRDIKPANLIAKPDGKIAVVDFGAAHVQGTTAGSTSIGTFGYMPIEQLAGQVDATTDVYALGASLIHLLSRREPWRLLQGVSLEGINVSPALRDFLSKIVAAEPSQRFANAQAALDGLGRAERGERIFPIVSAKPRRRFTRPALFATAAVGLAAAGYGAHALTTDDEPVGAQTGRVTIVFHPVEEANLYIDNQSWGKIGQGFTVELPAGEHFIRMGTGCRSSVMVEAGKHELFTCEVTPKDLLAGNLLVDMVGRPGGKLFVDNKLVSSVRGGSKVELPSGRRHIRIVADDGAFCERAVDIQPDATTSVVCQMSGTAPPPSLPPQPTIPPGKQVDLQFKQVSVHDVIRAVAEKCGINAAIPDYVDAKITLDLKKAPCDAVLEVMLESHGLWYRYDPTGNMLLVMPKNAIQREAENQVRRSKAGFVDDPLPTGPEMDLDFKEVPLHDLMRVMADSAGVNIVLPEHIDARVTVKFKKAKWDAALIAILESQGLWYRYRPNGKLLRIGTRNELDREAEQKLQK